MVASGKGEKSGARMQRVKSTKGRHEVDAVVVVVVRLLVFVRRRDKKDEGWFQQFSPELRYVDDTTAFSREGKAEITFCVSRARQFVNV